MVAAIRSFLQGAGHLQQDGTTAVGDASTGCECYIRKELCLSAIALIVEDERWERSHNT